jgi:16S rRNA C967 or C1407 C5-methylase (RsmB/RsmF family)
MEKPSKLLIKLAQRLFESADDRTQFIESLLEPKAFHPCILWCQKKPENFELLPEQPLPWQPEFVDRLALDAKPGKHPLHNAGAFYCLDFSSVFAASTLLAIPSKIELLLDMCAAPGGKSIFAWTALQPRLLMSNEVIGKRTAPLIANLKRCGISPAIVLRLDSKILAEEILQTVQVVLVDAPCTGQSLIAKGGKAPGCFHPVTINTNANRQKRILANSAQLVAPQGYLSYMTCAYSPEENEQVIDWFLERFPQFQPLQVSYLALFQSHLSDRPCYRMFPQSGLGSGAFTALLQNTAAGQPQPLSEAFMARPGLIVL